ncbi:hypothetical protein OG921_16070 [Aldersonia sp. NBC_00410]|uniref:hypothetical protein n=1 Tax=Aldersonia sp. NBC_00410 TaxID=2975954 RepID=UPI00224F4C90|nr:hypothetical protein [Aldersonia sp. NBC_00410]MCX5044684.1 hypothetical protein [Aldersonia sp. NBC_00410]
MPTRAEIQEFEEALLAQGGLTQGTIGMLPDQLLVWRPENTDWDFFPTKRWEESLGIGACLKRTVRGERGFVYESGDGITALVDFQGPTFPTENFGRSAPCIFRPLRRPLPRSELSRLGSLEKLFGKPGVPRSTQNISVSQAEGIASLLDDPLPPVILLPEVNFTDQGLIWNRASQVWGLEGPMRDVVLNTEAWQGMFRQKPQAEVGWGTEDRYDLFSEPDRAVAEFKLVATSATLVQLDRYLEGLRRDRGGNWLGHIVWGNSCTRGLIEAVKRRSDVALWRCDRTSDNQAHLVRID